MKLSILIPSLESRVKMLGALVAELARQVVDAGAHGEVEILTAPDKGEKTVGAKRNELIERAKGDFVVFVDDDDGVAEDYVFQILEAITQNPEIDCVGMRAIMTRGETEHQRQVVYSLHYPGGFESGGIYYRPPCHLTPVRRGIANQFRYGDVSLGEDANWSNNVAGRKVMKKEFFVDKILYHYRFNPKTSGTQQHYNVPVPNPSSADRWHVVILSRSADNLRGCLQALFEREPGLARGRVIVVDDGASDGFDHQAFPGIRWVKGIKPFVYARNANIGIRAAQSAVFLLNDDARLLSRFGFSSMAYALRDRQEIGICSSAIQGVAGGAGQTPLRRLSGIRRVPNVAFVAAHLSQKAITKIGDLDEEFTGYGFEDNDYCLRAEKNAIATAVYDGCLIAHNQPELSSFRSRPDWKKLMAQNRFNFEKKWGPDILEPVAPDPEPEEAWHEDSENYIKGKELFDKEEYEAAIPYFVAVSHGVEDADEKAQAMMMAGRCHGNVGRHDVALNWFDGAKALAPDRREIPFYRAVCLMRSTLLDDALKAIAECIAIPVSRRPFTRYDVLEVWSGLPEEARSFCTSQIEEAKAKAADQNRS